MEARKRLLVLDTEHDVKIVRHFVASEVAQEELALDSATVVAGSSRTQRAAERQVERRLSRGRHAGVVHSSVEPDSVAADGVSAKHMRSHPKFMACKIRSAQKNQKKKLHGDSIHSGAVHTCSMIDSPFRKLYPYF
jgi:hypothetical protein